MILANEETTVAGNRDRSPSSRSRRAYLIVMSGERIGHALEVISSSVLLGRGDDAGLILDEDGVSRHHAKVVLLSGNVCLVQDLGSTNGTYVNDVRVEAHPLEHGDRIRLGDSAWLRFSIEDKIESDLRAHLFAQATSDPLTGIKNRNAFHDTLTKELAYSRRHNSSLSLIIFDTDHFKELNDTYGHPVGDAVLKAVAERVSKTIRTEDHFSRIGGEEFSLILRGIDRDGVILAAERIRKCIADAPIAHRELSVTLTISLGCATFESKRHQQREDLIQDADQQLYRAKASGRNRSCQCDMVAHGDSK
jgi:two-component system, cell cycle response regulator